jgi:hypothetical protein
MRLVTRALADRAISIYGRVVALATMIAVFKEIYWVAAWQGIDKAVFINHSGEAWLEFFLLATAILALIYTEINNSVGLCQKKHSIEGKGQEDGK